VFRQAASVFGSKKQFFGQKTFSGLQGCLKVVTSLVFWHNSSPLKQSQYCLICVFTAYFSKNMKGSGC